MPYTVAQIINIAKVSQYLAQIDVAKGRLFGPRKIPMSPQILYAERKAVEWLYDIDPTNSTLTLTANYLYSLCRGYNLQAANIVNSGSGGSVSPISPTLPPPFPYQFEVTTTSFIAEGDTSKVFPSAWIGREILFIRNAVPQGTVVLTQSNYYSWDSATATLTLFGPAPPDGNNGAATETEQFQIFPV